MPELKYKNLFSPITIRGKTFKNRILAAPMGTDDEAAGGYISERCAYFYERVAKGGSARVCTVEAPINYGTANRNCLTFFDDVPSPGFRRNMSLFSALCHRHGSLAFTSFTHNGIYMHPEVRLFKGPIPKDKEGNDKPVDMSGKFYGPSEMELHEPWDGITVGSIPTGNFDGRHIHAYTRERLEQIADDYAHCASVAESVGMDGCIVHAGHGFLFSQFVSRRTNMRTDEFGGSMENRATVIGFSHVGIYGLSHLQGIGVRNVVPSSIARMVPFGLFHISWRPYSSTRCAFGVIVAHLTPTWCRLMASAASVVTASRVASRFSRPRS